MHDWYYAAHEASPQGPVSEADLRQMLDSGQLPAATLIWRDGMAAWLRADHPAVAWHQAPPPPPALPALPTVPSPVPAARPAPVSMPTGQRTALLILLAACALVFAVFVLGILAAIALPAYRQYVSASHVSQRLQALEPVQDAMVAHHRIHGQCPPADSDSMSATLAGADTPGISELTAVTAINGHCGLSMVLDGLHRDEQQTPARLWLEYVPGQSEWICRSTLRDTQLPRRCRRDATKD